MKLRMATIGLLMAMALTSCSPTVARVEETQPAATPKPTPHPATGARARAVQLYPDLAVRDSLFNRTFVELVEHTAQRDPMLLASIDWPITLAHQTARILGVTSDDLASAPKRQTEVPSARQENPLEKGAYNHTRALPRSTNYYYWNGSSYTR